METTETIEVRLDLLHDQTPLAYREAIHAADASGRWTIARPEVDVSGRWLVLRFVRFPDE